MKLQCYAFTVFLMVRKHWICLYWCTFCSTQLCCNIPPFQKYLFTSNYNFWLHFRTLVSYSLYPTWSHKNTYLCALSVRHCFMYLTARFAAVSKRNVHWVALKQVKYVNPLTFFYYIYIGTYCCVFITWLQKRIAAVQNSNIRGLSLKVNAL